MSKPSPAIRALAKQLLDAEAVDVPVAEANAHSALRVCEKLRRSLVPFVGVEGYTVLLRRSLALARADVPSLQTMKVGTEGVLELTERSPAGWWKENEEAIALVSRLLGLLMIFIGGSLTLRLIRKAFPVVTNQMIVESEEER